MFFADTDILSAFAKADAVKYLKQLFADLKTSRILAANVY
jgi:hypothetical protein